MGRPTWNDCKPLLPTDAVATSAGFSTQTCDASIGGKVRGTSVVSDATKSASLKTFLLHG